MILNDLFKYINQLNKINLKLGVEQQYAIKFSSKISYEKLDCFNKYYTDINKFINDVSDESYFTDIENAQIELFESAYDITDLEYETTFSGVTTGIVEEVSIDVCIYIVKI